MKLQHFKQRTKHRLDAYNTHARAEYEESIREWLNDYRRRLEHIKTMRKLREERENSDWIEKFTIDE